MVATPLMCVYCQISSLYIKVIIKFLLIHSIVHQKLRNFDALLFARKHFVPKVFSIKENFQTSLLEVIKNGWCVQVERSHLIWQRRAAWKLRCQIRFLPDQWRNFTAHNNSNFSDFSLPLPISRPSASFSLFVCALVCLCASSFVCVFVSLMRMWIFFYVILHWPFPAIFCLFWYFQRQYKIFTH